MNWIKSNLNTPTYYALELVVYLPNVCSLCSYHIVIFFSAQTFRSDIINVFMLTY
jgi:hypothetical protein